MKYILFLIICLFFTSTFYLLYIIYQFDKFTNADIWKCPWDDVNVNEDDINKERITYNFLNHSLSQTPDETKAKYDKNHEPGSPYFNNVLTPCHFYTMLGTSLTHHMLPKCAFEKGENFIFYKNKLIIYQLLLHRYYGINQKTGHYELCKEIIFDTLKLDINTKNELYKNNYAIFTKKNIRYIIKIYDNDYIKMVASYASININFIIKEFIDVDASENMMYNF